MNIKHYTKMVHEGDYAAEVDVELIYEDEGWSPYLSLGTLASSTMSEKL